MKFRTEIFIDKSDNLIVHNNNILTIGSCFAQNIAEYFQHYRFNILCNPFGVLYNPVSIFNSIKLVKEKKKFTTENLIEHQSEWRSFYHHSDFSHHDQNICLANINKGITETADFLQNADVVIITFGTAYVFRHIEQNIIVSNCHKFPSSEFHHYLLSLEETVKPIENIVNLINSINKHINIIFTVSPVRHWKDGAVNNQLSKSTLLLAIQEVLKKNSNCEYFPSYEIIIDDLRDYRFYSEDLLHPNKVATDYIWEKFSDAKLSETCINIMNEVEKVVKSREHRVRNNQSKNHQEFCKTQIERINHLQKNYPHLNLAEDEAYFRDQLI